VRPRRRTSRAALPQNLAPAFWCAALICAPPRPRAAALDAIKSRQIPVALSVVFAPPQLRAVRILTRPYLPSAHQITAQHGTGCYRIAAARHGSGVLHNGHYTFASHMPRFRKLQRVTSYNVVLCKMTPAPPLPPLQILY